ncbi:MAG: hypothetical protein NW208_13610 [Bryobacter sp.]|nr:hypothetical protein [Bryobacter sp.]
MITSLSEKEIEDAIAQHLAKMEDREMVHAASVKFAVDWAGDDAIYVHLRFADEAFPPIRSKKSIHPVVERAMGTIRNAIHERVLSPFVYFRVETDSEAEQ